MSEEPTDKDEALVAAQMKKKDPVKPDPLPPPEQKKDADIAASDSIDRANVAAKRLEDANKEHERLLAIQQKLQIQDTLGGQTEAGNKPKKDENASAKRYLKGTDWENEVFPDAKKQ